MVVALVWVPSVGVVDMVRRRRPRRWGTPAAAALDVVGLAVVVAAVPSVAPVATWLPFVLVALYSQQDLRVGITLAVVAVGVATAAQLQAPLPGPDLVPVLLYAVVLGGVVWLQRGWEASRAETSVALSLAHGRAETVLANIADAVVVTGPGRRVHRINPAGEHTLGCSAGVAVGAACHDVFELRRNGVRLDCSRGCPLLATEGASDAGVELTRSLPTGVVQPLLATARAVQGPDGEAIEVVHSLQDITELKRAQDAQTLFLATATHELKTPLTLIVGFAEMLRHRPDMDEQQRDLAASTIHRRALELDRIVEQLLLSSRIGSGHLELELTAGDVTDTVREVVGAFTGITPDREIHWYSDAGPLPDADHEPGALRTVLEHLLDNALKYSPDGGPVEVGVTRTDRGVDISVTDQGIGMTPDQQRRCFDRFWQAEGDSVRRFAGTGLGLHIVRSLVDAMHGSLTVISAPGEGTTFRITLVRTDAPDAPDAPDVPLTPPDGERTMVDEFMRQAGLREAPS